MAQRIGLGAVVVMMSAFVLFLEDLVFGDVFKMSKTNIWLLVIFAGSAIIIIIIFSVGEPTEKK